MKLTATQMNLAARALRRAAYAAEHRAQWNNAARKHGESAAFFAGAANASRHDKTRQWNQDASAYAEEARNRCATLARKVKPRG